jgi:hypothetical protein
MILRFLPFLTSQTRSPWLVISILFSPNSRELLIGTSPVAETKLLRI